VQCGQLALLRQLDLDESESLLHGLLLRHHCLTFGCQLFEPLRLARSSQRCLQLVAQRDDDFFLPLDLLVLHRPNTDALVERAVVAVRRS
jgi:hypothetical protein